MNKFPSKRICLTPTRNEKWIIGPFVTAAKQWADRVVVVDQGSTDGTLEELQSKPDVDVVINESVEFDEHHRQELLLSAARETSEKRILFALDADEVFSANFRESQDWDKIEAAEPGTVLRFRWVNILPGFREAWVPKEPITLGFVDDGSPNMATGRIHNPRLPHPENAPILDLKEVVVLHFQYVLWDRMLHKQRWYQAWEKLHSPDKGALEIFRTYNHMYGGWNPEEIQPVKKEWLNGYDRPDCNLRNLECEEITLWEKEIVEMLQKHGAKKFSKIAIWDQDWQQVAAKMGIQGYFEDPRSLWERLAHRLLKRSQTRREKVWVRVLERCLRSIGW